MNKLDTSVIGKMIAEHGGICGRCIATGYLGKVPVYVVEIKGSKYYIPANLAILPTKDKDNENLS
jgi:hypothetical protein